MHKRYLNFCMVVVILLSFISYKEVSAQSLSYNDVSPASGPVKFVMHLDKSVPYVGATKAHNTGYYGQNQYVVVIDTGVDVSHSFLKDKVALEACFSASCPNGQKSMIGLGAAKPVHWHGTHVSGIVAGSNSSFKGVAPSTKIIAVNVFDINRAAYDQDIVSALNWVGSISNDYNIVAVNMSLGSSQVFKTTCDGYIPEMTQAIKNLRDKNIATVVSSGNSYAVGMSAPACISDTVSVAATFSQSDSITSFSNVSELTTIAAPGNMIQSASVSDAYRYASGTSMAAPHVSGAFALYRSKFGSKSVSGVISDLINQAPKALDSYSGIKIPRLYFDLLFGDGTPVTTTTTVPVTTTTTLPTTTTTTVPSPTTTTVVPPSPTTTVPKPPFYPTMTKPLLLDLYGGYKTAVYVKYRVPVIGRTFVSYYNLYCDKNQTYVIPHQNKYSIDTYKLNVPASSINMCYMTAVSIYGKETTPSSFAHIYPKNK